MRGPLSAYKDAREQPDFRICRCKGTARFLYGGEMSDNILKLNESGKNHKVWKIVAFFIMDPG